MPLPPLEHLNIIERLVGNDELTKAFQFTNFGGAEPRDVVRTALSQIAGGYSTGSTALRCCRELGLVGKSGLTKKGRRYLYHANEWLLTSTPRPTRAQAVGTPARPEC